MNRELGTLIFALPPHPSQDIANAHHLRLLLKDVSDVYLANFLKVYTDSEVENSLDSSLVPITV